MLGITVMLVLAVRLFSLSEAASADKGALKVAEAKKICDASGALKVVARHAAEVRKTTCGQAVDLVLSSDDHAAATQAVALAAHTASEAARENATPETLSAAKFLAGLATAARHAARARATADTVEVLAEQLATRMDSMLEVFEKYTHSGGGAELPALPRHRHERNHKKTIDTEKTSKDADERQVGRRNRSRERSNRKHTRTEAGQGTCGPGSLEDSQGRRFCTERTSCILHLDAGSKQRRRHSKRRVSDRRSHVERPLHDQRQHSENKVRGANGNAANANFTHLQQLVTQLDAEKDKACKACSLDTRAFGNTNTGRTICGGAGTATHETAAQEITKLHDAIQKRLQESRRANDQTTQTEKEKHTTTRNSQHLPDKGTKLSEREREEGAQKRDTTASATSTQDTTRRRAPIGTAACLHLVVAWTHSQRERNKQ
ncbi:hypothetical protein ERJ75_001705700 [Trypanosoma vivax]|nr:hypothetical protein ERJ75_001705700 [Trypanosoma vivax]